MTYDAVVTTMAADGAMAFCRYTMLMPTIRFWRVRRGFVETVLWREHPEGLIAESAWYLSTYTTRELEDHISGKQWIKL